MIDEFVAQIRELLPGYTRSSLGRTITYFDQETLNKMPIDVYGCAWYIMIAGIYSTQLSEYIKKFYSDVPEKSLVDDKSLQSLANHLQNDLSRFQGLVGSWNHSRVSIDDVQRMFMQIVRGNKFEFDGWIRAGASNNQMFQPLGLVADKFLAPEFFGRHASNVGTILNWDASFMDADDSKYKSMVIDKWPEIIDRIKRRFAPDDKKLPRFCYGFNDFYLLRPVAISILRSKPVPYDIFGWFCLWHFRRRWGSNPSDMLYAKAICKEWERFREVIYKLNYKRNHLFNCLMRILHELKTLPLTREQIGDIYPSMIRAALKRNDKVAAEFLQTL